MKTLNNHIILTLIAIFSTNVYFLMWFLMDEAVTQRNIVAQLSFYEFMSITNGALLIISIFSVTYKKMGDQLIENGFSNRFRFFFKVLLSVFIFVMASLLLFAIHFMVKTASTAFENVQDVMTSPYFTALVIFFSFTSILMFFISNLERRSGNISTLFFRSMGEFIQPTLTKRGFLFIDLNDATRLAEQLGSERYAKLLRDCFRLLNELVSVSNFEVYQYVGDEAVITWKASHRNSDLKALQLFNDYKAYLEEHKTTFLQEYGIQPTFKCAIHFGEVVVSEIGKDVKHLVYHGDVLNTASRLLSQCHFYHTDCIISAATIQQKERIDKKYYLNAITANNLKGKEKHIHAYTVQIIQNSTIKTETNFFKQK
ncbi:MAG: adenylate/guanylate cyclase domain-containing protein [Bacteroidota bacterium]